MVPSLHPLAFIHFPNKPFRWLFVDPFFLFVFSPAYLLRWLRVCLSRRVVCVPPSYRLCAPSALFYPLSGPRVAVLKAWASIAERGALPRVRVLIAARLGRDRLRDQSSMVRKEAVRVSIQLRVSAMRGGEEAVLLGSSVVVDWFVWDVVWAARASERARLVALVDDG